MSFDLLINALIAGILLGGMLLCAALSVTMTILARGQLDQGLQAWDERGLRWVEQHGPMKFPDAVLAESPGNLAYLIPLRMRDGVPGVRGAHGATLIIPRPRDAG